MNYFVHPTAIVDSIDIGEKTRIWAFVHIFNNVKIGEDCNICDHCLIESNVILGNRVTVKSGIYIWDGVEIEDDVILGPNVVFTNDIRPRSKNYKEIIKTVIGKGSSIGANSTILAGVTIGKYAMTGIGTVVTRDIPDYALVYGNPGKQKGWVDENGEKLTKLENNKWISKNGNIYMEDNNKLFPLK